MVAANRAAVLLFGADLVDANLLERYLTDTGLRQAIVNWPEVAGAVLSRLRRQLHQEPLDERLRSLVNHAEDAVCGLPVPPDTHVHSLVVCPGSGRAAA